MFNHLINTTTDTNFTLQNKSKRYDIIIKGYEYNKEHNEEVMKLIYGEIDKEDLDNILSLKLPKNENIISVWEFVIKWDLYIKDKIKEILVSHIYNNMSYKIEIKKNTISTTVSIIYTCVFQ